jgi:hypothetical protein
MEATEISRKEKPTTKPVAFFYRSDQDSKQIGAERDDEDRADEKSELEPILSIPTKPTQSTQT